MNYIRQSKYSQSKIYNQNRFDKNLFSQFIICLKQEINIILKINIFLFVSLLKVVPKEKS